MHYRLRGAAQRGPGLAAGGYRLGWHGREVDVAALIGGAQLERGREAGALRPVRGDLVQAPDRGRHGGPVDWPRWGAVEPGLHDDAVDMAAAIEGRDYFRDPQAVPGQVIQQPDFPVQAGR